MSKLNEIFDSNDLDELIDLDKQLYYDISMSQADIRVLMRHINGFIHRIKNNMETIISFTPSNTKQSLTELFHTDMNRIKKELAEFEKNIKLLFCVLNQYLLVLLIKYC